MVSVWASPPLWPSFRPTSCRPRPMPPRRSFASSCPLPAWSLSPWSPRLRGRFWPSSPSSPSSTAMSCGRIPRQVVPTSSAATTSAPILPRSPVLRCSSVTPSPWPYRSLGRIRRHHFSRSRLVARSHGSVPLRPLCRSFGLRQPPGHPDAGKVFAVPTYFFIVNMAGLIVYGLVKEATGSLQNVPSTPTSPRPLAIPPEG